MNQMNRSVVFSFGLMVLITCVSFSGGRAPEKGEKAQKEEIEVNRNSANTDSADFELRDRDEIREMTKEQRLEYYKKESEYIYRENLPNLIRQLREETNPDGKADLINMVGKVNDPSVIPVLIEIITNEYENQIVKNCAIRTLSRIKDDNSAIILKSAMKDHKQSYETRKTAAYYVGNTGDKTAIPILIEMLKDPNLKEAAAHSIVKLGEGGRVADIISDQLKAGNITEKLVALDDLMSIGTQKALNDIKKALDDDNKQVQWRAVQHLSSSGEKDSVWQLIMKKYKSKDVMERYSALVTLGMLGDSDSTELIKKALNDKDPYIANQAQNILNKIHK